MLVSSNVKSYGNYNYTFLLSSNSNYNLTENNNTCVHQDTKVLLINGEIKKIKDIKRGDYVITDKETNESKQVAKVLSGYSSHYLVKIPKNTINNEKELICTGNHPIWINNQRILAKNIPRVQKLNKKDITYNMQFEEEGSFYANDIKVDSISPYASSNLLEKELFFNPMKYIKNYLVSWENDSKRNKPLLVNELD